MKILKDFCAECDLLDAAENIEPRTLADKPGGANGQKDFILVTQSLLCNITSANTVNARYKTDHF